MNININNYQEYLLLYIDGELSVDKANMVEQFIEQNAFVKAELDVLLQTKLPNILDSFDGIEKLLKQENTEISINNYIEKFTLYVDNELTNQERNQVETFVLKHPNTQKDFTAFNKAKLDAITIKHPNKAELYRKNKTIVFYLQRFGIAAAIMGIAFMVILNIKTTNIKETELEFVRNVDTNSKNIKTIQDGSSLNIISKNNASENIARKSQVNIEKSTIGNTNNASTYNNSTIKTAPNSTQQLNNNNNSSNTTYEENIVVNNANTSDKIKETINNNSANNVLVNTTNNQINKTDVAINKNAINNNTASTIIYKNLDDDDEENTSSNKQSSTLKSFFNKATSLINKEGSDDASKKIISLTLK